MIFGKDNGTLGRHGIKLIGDCPWMIVSARMFPILDRVQNFSTHGRNSTQLPSRPMLPEHREIGFSHRVRIEHAVGPIGLFDQSTLGDSHLAIDDKMGDVNVLRH